MKRRIFLELGYFAVDKQIKEEFIPHILEKLEEKYGFTLHAEKGKAPYVWQELPHERKNQEYSILVARKENTIDLINGVSRHPEFPLTIFVPAQNLEAQLETVIQQIQSASPEFLSTIHENYLNAHYPGWRQDNNLRGFKPPEAFEYQN